MSFPCRCRCNRQGWRKKAMEISLCLGLLVVFRVSPCERLPSWIQVILFIGLCVTPCRR